MYEDWRRRVEDLKGKGPNQLLNEFRNLRREALNMDSQKPDLRAVKWIDSQCDKVLEHLKDAAVTETGSFSLSRSKSSQWQSSRAKATFDSLRHLENTLGLKNAKRYFDRMKFYERDMNRPENRAHVTPARSIPSSLRNRSAGAAATREIGDDVNAQKERTKLRAERDARTGYGRKNTHQ